MSKISVKELMASPPKRSNRHADSVVPTKPVEPPSEPTAIKNSTEE